MVNYPVYVPRKHYKGRNPREREKARRYNEVAKLCEDYLNKKILENPEEIQQYTYGFMAPDLGLTTDEVLKVMFAVDAGHNGVTVRKSLNKPE